MAKILVADDEAHIRMLLEQTLEELEDDGAELILTADGAEALAAIQSQRPDLVFLDVMMPKMNGFDVCSQVKSDPELASTFVILLTAKGQEFDKQKGLEVGANLYMTKPFNPDVIVAKAREVLGL